MTGVAVAVVAKEAKEAADAECGRVSDAVTDVNAKAVCNPAASARDVSLSVKEVVAACVNFECEMVALRSYGRGQGAALSTALASATADLISEMEADDETPPDRLRLMCDALLQNPEWDAVTTQ
eukprot:1548730-Pleurochrysis_carterae.AAC.1